MATLAQQAYIAKLYVGYFGRLMDNEGLNYWSGELDSRGMDAVANGIYAGAQGSDQAIWGMGNQAYVEQVYMNVLNRAGDAEGVAYWTGELAKGVGRDVVVQRILDGTNNPGNESDKARLENMGTVALYFANNYESTKSAPPIDTKNAVTADPATVETAKKMVDGTHNGGGTTPPPVANQTFNLDDSKKDYAADVKGGDGHDTYNITDFKTASIDGGNGSDTLNFMDYQPADGEDLVVDLRAGTASDGLKVTWVENVIGTEGDDTITGNHDANVITMMGGADTIDGYLGDDLIIAADMDNVADSFIINGGSGKDTLKILAAEIDMATVGDVARSIEVLKVGYDGVEEEAAAATVDLTGFDNSTMGVKEIHANTTKVYDRKGVEEFDTIVSDDEEVDLTGIALHNFEVLSAELADKITIGGSTLTMLKEVIGSGDTDLELVGKDGDVFDLSAPKLTDIETLIAPVTAKDSLTEIKATVIMGQKQLDDLAFAGDFSNATLQLKGQGVDMTGVVFNTAGIDNSDPADGDFLDAGDVVPFVSFDEIKYGLNDTKSLLLSSDAVAELADGETIITGSEFDTDMLSIRGLDAFGDPDDVSVDMVGIVTQSIESLDFENVTDVTLDNMVLHGKEGENTPTGDVNNIAGDSALDTVILNGNALDDDGEVVALDLGGIKLRDIGALGDELGDDQNLFSIDTATILGTTASAYGEIQLAEAGSYDLSGIKNTVSDDGLGNTDALLITGSKGDDIVKGPQDDTSYAMGTGNDTVNAGDGDDTIDGGAGHDTLNGGKGDDEMLGGAGNDTIDGGDGADLIYGNSGVDSLTGGKGDDSFLFTSGDSGTTTETVDCINDFTFTADGDQDVIEFTFLTDSTVAADVGIGDMVFDDVGTDFEDEDSLLDAANAALEALFADQGDDLDLLDTDGDVLAVQFEFGGQQYLAVDAYVVEDSVSSNFIVKLAGLADGALSDAFDNGNIVVSGSDVDPV